jgi:hypothetical protein
MVIPNKECFINKDPISFIFINIPDAHNSLGSAPSYGSTTSLEENGDP